MPPHRKNKSSPPSRTISTSRTTRQQTNDQLAPVPDPLQVVITVDAENQQGTASPPQSDAITNYNANNNNDAQLEHITINNDDNVNVPSLLDVNLNQDKKKIHE